MPDRWIVALAAIVGISIIVSASAFAAGRGFISGVGPGFIPRGGETGTMPHRYFHPDGIGFGNSSRRGSIGGVFWPGYGARGLPFIGTDSLPDFADYESICGFFWVDRIFGQRIIRQRVYVCS